jgi:hypothetical protein
VKDAVVTRPFREVPRQFVDDERGKRDRPLLLRLRDVQLAVHFAGRLFDSDLPT